MNNHFLNLRRLYKPRIPALLQNLNLVHLKKAPSLAQDAKIKTLFPHLASISSFLLAEGKGAKKDLRVGAFFSGGQAPGGHNVIAGLWDALAEIGNCTLFGFLGGPKGLIEGKVKELSSKDIDVVRNTGGFDLIGSGRTKIETEEQMALCMQVCNTLALDGVVVIGGDDSNTNAALLAEFFLEHKCKTLVVGVPKTIDGDLKTKEIEISFGFDSACKTYSEIIGNIARDALSARKYYHFIKLMGRSASHVALECALATHPNLLCVAEEKKTLLQIVQEIKDLICLRSNLGKDFGIILIPEGLIEFMPEMSVLIEEINRCSGQTLTLSKEAKLTFQLLPKEIQEALLSERDPHGNIALSQVATEHLLIALVKEALKKEPSYKGKFSPISHFLGYEGRACFPSNFDANYCTTLGRLAALAIRDGVTGAICSVQNLGKDVQDWQFLLVPIVSLMHMEMRKGKEKPVIRKSLVDLQGKAFSFFAAHKKAWGVEDAYQFPGPMQFFGSLEITDTVPYILQKEIL